MRRCICRAKAKVHDFTPISRGLASMRLRIGFKAIFPALRHTGNTGAKNCYCKLLLMECFISYRLRQRPPWNVLRHSNLLVKCFHLNAFSGRKNKQKLNYAKMHMQGEGKSSRFYPQIQWPCF